MVGRSLLFLIAIFAFTGSIVSAETVPSTDSAKPRFQKIQSEIKEKRNEEKRELIVQKAAIVQAQNQELRDIVKAKREEMASEVKANREELRLQLDQLKDTRKKMVAQNVDEKLARANQQSTDRMALALDRLDKLLDKFSSRAATLEAEGKDATEVNATISDAESAIAVAESAVASQAAKIYTPEVVDENSLRSSFGQTVKQLRTDLKATHDIVKAAKQKVIDVAKALAKLHSSVSSTPSTTPAVSPTDSSSI